MTMAMKEILQQMMCSGNSDGHILPNGYTPNSTYNGITPPSFGLTDTHVAVPNVCETDHDDPTPDYI